MTEDLAVLSIGVKYLQVAVALMMKVEGRMRREVTVRFLFLCSNDLCGVFYGCAADRPILNTYTEE